MNLRPRLRRALTLLECLLLMALFTIVVLGSMRVIIDGREMRAIARDKAVMLTLVQGELDRLRTSGADPAAAGTAIWREPEWPAGVTMSRTVTARPDGLLDVTVEAQRPTHRRLIVARLATVVAGEAHP
jgi:Tfp pilus assembly protein PilX